MGRIGGILSYNDFSVLNQSIRGSSVMQDKADMLRELESRGEAIYRERIRHLVEPPETGKFVVIDIYSGDYEIDERDADASGRLLSRHPNALTWAVRVGYPTAYSWTRLQGTVC